MLPMIGLTGLARSGKDTTADLLVADYGYTKLAFADPLREMASTINPLVAFYPKWNNLSREYTRVPVYYNDAVNNLGYEAAKSSYAELRRFLQRLGTEWGRNTQGESYWVNQAMERAGRWERGDLDAPGPGPYVFTDVRFPNEADAIVDRGGVIVKVVRGKGILGTEANHPSENSMDGYSPIHYTLDNSGDKTQLVEGIATLIGDLEASWVTC